MAGFWAASPGHPKKPLFREFCGTEKDTQAGEHWRLTGGAPRVVAPVGTENALKHAPGGRFSGALFSPKSGRWVGALAATA